MKKQAKVWYLH